MVSLVLSLLLSLVVSASFVFSSAAVAGAAGPAGSAISATSARWTPSTYSSPPVPPGTTRVRPRIYPGGGLFNFGDAPRLEPLLPQPLNAPIVDAARVPGSNAMWFVGADGGVYAVGGAPFYGSLGELTLQGPIVAFAPRPTVPAT